MFLDCTDFVILLFAEAIDLGFAMIVRNGDNSAVSAFDVNWISHSWRFLTTKCIDKNVKWVVA